MDNIYKLKDMLCDELEEYGKRGELSAGSLDIIDKLSHALKSVTTIIAMEDADGDYSGNTYPRGDGRRSYRSYASGRRNARRDSMGRYSREYNRDYSGAVEDMVSQLRDMMDEAPDQTTRSEIQRLVSKMEKM